MARDSEATAWRLLRAAIEEFSAHGLAGGRVDRISAAARANKRAIYDHYGSKDQLFDAAVRRVADEVIASVPLDPDDLPGYAGALFDYLLAHPEARRLLGWRRLERPEAVPRLATRFVEDLGAGTLANGATGVAEGLPVVDVAILVIGLANAWDLSGVDLVRAAGEDPTDPGRVATHRAAVVEAAQRIAAAR